MTCVKNCHVPITISRDYLSNPSWDLRLRYEDLPNSGIYYHKSASQNFKFNAAFHSQLGAAINVIALHAGIGDHGTLQWIGTAGTENCRNGCHSSSKAFDLTLLKFSHITLDMNTAWESYQPMSQRRGYLAVWAGLRMYCINVITNTYNVHHEDHIHADNGENPSAPVPTIRSYARTDTKLVQTACNLLNNAGLAVDGIWGPLTNQAYNSLLIRMNMQCLSPRTNFWHARAFLSMIALHGFADASAGTYTYPFCSQL